MPERRTYQTNPGTRRHARASRARGQSTLGTTLVGVGLARCRPRESRHSLSGVLGRAPAPPGSFSCVRGVGAGADERGLAPVGARLRALCWQRTAVVAGEWMPGRPEIPSSESPAARPHSSANCAERTHERAEGAGTCASTSDVVLRDEPVTGIDDPARTNVVNVAHGIDPSDVRRRVAQAPGNSHPAEVRKGLGQVDGPRHRQFEAPDSIVADIAPEPRPDGFHDILMQTINGAAAGEKDRDIVPGLPGLGMRVSMTPRAQHDSVDRVPTPLDEPGLRLALGKEPVERIDAERPDNRHAKQVPWYR